MSTKTALLLYTHNLLHRPLFEATLSRASEQAKRNGSLLVVVSHFPIHESYEDISNQFCSTPLDKKIGVELTKHVIQDFRLQGDHIKNYITGRLNYTSNSILQQIIAGINKCHELGVDKILFYEHDCFYPGSYLPIIDSILDIHDMTFGLDCYSMVNKNGFFKCSPHVYLSSYAARTSVFLAVFQNKKEVYLERENSSYVRNLEPVVPYQTVVMDVTWNDHNGTKRAKIDKPYHGESVADGMVIRNSLDSPLAQIEKVTHDAICIDGLMGNTSILECEHGLNTTNALFLMRKIYDNLTPESVKNLDDDYRRYIGPSMNHPYWGDATPFIDLIKNDYSGRLFEYIRLTGLHTLRV